MKKISIHKSVEFNLLLMKRMESLVLISSNIDNRSMIRSMLPIIPQLLDLVLQGQALRLLQAWNGDGAQQPDDSRRDPWIDIQLWRAKDDVGSHRAAYGAHCARPSKAQTPHLSRVHFGNVNVKDGPKAAHDKSIEDESPTTHQFEQLLVVIVFEVGQSS